MRPGDTADLRRKGSRKEGEKDLTTLHSTDDSPASDGHHSLPSRLSFRPLALGHSVHAKRTKSALVLGGGESLKLGQRQRSTGGKRLTQSGSQAKQGPEGEDLQASRP